MLKNRPATIHWCTGTSRYFLPRYEYCILNKLSRYLRYIYICINKHGKALSFCFLVLMHGDFPNKLTRKIHAEQCLALYSRWRTQQTHACFHACFHVQFQYVCYRNKPFLSNNLLVLLLCNVSYRDTYRIVEKCIVAGLLKNMALVGFPTWFYNVIFPVL